MATPRLMTIRGTRAEWTGLLRRFRAATAFTGLLLICEVVYHALPSSDASGLAAWASTNVERLGSEPLGPLVASAFVVDDRPLAWLALCAAALGAYEWRAGWWRVFVVAATAHVLGTLLSEGIVWWRLDIHDLPGSAREQLDIGVSYVVVGVLAATVVVARRRERMLAAVLLVALAPLLLDGLWSLDVAAVGHLTASLVGAATAWLLRIPGPDPRSGQTGRAA